MNGQAIRGHMKRKTLFFLLLCVTVPFAWIILLHSQDAPGRGLQLLQSAHHVSDLTQLLPYSIQASIVLDPGMVNEKKGQITIYRDHERSRTELQVEDYREIRTTLGNKLHIWRSTQFPLPALSHLTETDFFVWDRLAKDGNARMGGVSRKKVRNAPADCFEVLGDQSHRRHRLCFDPARKVLLETLELQFALEFSDYTAVDQVLFPRKIIMSKETQQSERPILVFENIQVRKASFTANSFVIPQPSLEFETCDKMQPAKSLTMPLPRFPSQVMRGNAVGVTSVNAYGIIDKEGKLGNIKVFSSDEQVIQPVLDALKKWRYSPAMCGSSPVATEEEVVFPFSESGIMDDRPLRP
jgi:Gram-negative bacterial TonB protein C-terminal